MAKAPSGGTSGATVDPVILDPGIFDRGIFDLIIFDMDGVLVDSEPISARITTEALAEAGAPIGEAELTERFLGTSSSSILKIVADEHGLSLPPSFEETVRGRALAAFERELEAMPGITALLDGLMIRRCVASSSHPDRIRRSLELTRLYDRLAPHLFSATMVRRGKPAPDVFLLAAERMAATPARCVVLEDSEAGIRAAKAAGMTAIGFTGGSHIEAESHGPRLRAAGADAVVADFARFAELVGEA